MFHKTVLDNGLTVVAETHTHTRTVSIGIWIKIGSSFETPLENGVSHFVEHMVFRGTHKRTSLEIATVLECLGGELNAFTEREFTCFHANVLSEHIEVAIDVLSDLVMHPVFDSKQLAREKKVLLQELSLIEEAPEEWIYDLFFKTAWKKQPLGQPVIGTKKNINQMTRKDLRRFFTQHYRPENMVLSLAGNVNFDEVVALARKHFDFSNAEGFLPLTPQRSQYKAVRRSFPLVSEQAHLLIGFESFGFMNPSRYDALILSFFLGGGMSSRLFQEVREKAALSYNIDCEFVPFRDTGLFSVYASLAPRSVRAYLEIISTELGLLKSQLLKEEEMNLVKGQLRGTILMCADQMDVRQESLGRNEVIFGRYVPVEEVISEIESVSPQTVHDLAKQLFVSEKMSMIHLGKRKLHSRHLELF